MYVNWRIASDFLASLHTICITSFSKRVSETSWGLNGSCRCELPHLVACQKMFTSFHNKLTFQLLCLLSFLCHNVKGKENDVISFSSYSSVGASLKFPYIIRSHDMTIRRVARRFCRMKVKLLAMSSHSYKWHLVQSRFDDGGEATRCCLKF